MGIALGIMGQLQEITVRRLASESKSENVLNIHIESNAGFVGLGGCLPAGQAGKQLTGGPCRAGLRTEEGGNGL